MKPEGKNQALPKGNGQRWVPPRVPETQGEFKITAKDHSPIATDGWMEGHVICGPEGGSVAG